MYYGKPLDGETISVYYYWGASSSSSSKVSNLKDAKMGIIPNILTGARKQ